MTSVVITEEIKAELEQFLKKHRKPELVSTYLFYLEKKNKLHPVLYPKEKTIYLSAEDAVKHLESQGKLWRETEIKIGFGPPTVNEETKKIYICPFTGKVFGDNTHPHPQDAIYDWVSKCPENTERIDGLRVKRFFVSEDPEVIKNYIAKRKKPISKVVYSAVYSGKLYNTKEAIIEDFKRNYLKPLTLVEVQNQNRFQIEESFLAFIKKHLVEDKLAAFVEALANFNVFKPFISEWIDEGDEE
jgi:hypothetical protein